MHQWLALSLFLLLTAGVAFGMLLVARIFRVKPHKVPPPTRHMTYECGEEPDGDAWIRFHPRYYVVALLFVLFDVEAAFLLPWALNLEELGRVALIDMGIFLVILLLGWVYALRKGAIKWQ
jgi:NADH:ubiquinone oxidoreductase subunit 3 (subunit A)